MLHGALFLVEARRLAALAPCLAAIADRWVPGRAGLAMAAKSGEAGDHMISRLHVRDVGANLFDYPRRFVPQHDGQAVGIEALDEMQIAMADTRSGGPHQNFPRPGLFDRYVLNGKWLSNLVQNGGFHRVAPFSRLMIIVTI